MTDFTNPELVRDYFEGLAAEEISLHPLLKEVIGNVSGVKVLDAGCGSGWLCRHLASIGCEVRGIDSSAQQIEIAKKSNAHQNACYQVADITLFRTKDLFDLVVYNMILIAFSSLAEVQRSIRVARKHLTPHGRFVIGTVHPLFLVSGQDDSDRGRNFDFKNYFSDGSPFQAECRFRNGKYFVFDNIHLSLSGLSRILREEGFVVAQIFESRPVLGVTGNLPKYLVIEATGEK